ncbi:MAG: T9SS type A sorting domain-containing protein [Proteobacteria bacterium]|nr:T9SS type A sorting domain-containing protein [Pseudomonadota bacterium]
MSKKLTFLVLALIVVFSISLMAEPAPEPINRTIPTVNVSRNAAAAVLVTTGVNYRSFLPEAENHISVAPNGQIGVFYGRGSGIANYSGEYFYFSTDYGATWTQSPATGPVIAADSFYDRSYTALTLGSDAMGYAPYGVANIRESGGAPSDTIMFVQDQSGLGAGDWVTAVVADNGDGAYRYLPNIAVMNDADIFVPIWGIGGDLFLSHSGDYGSTWSQIYHFDSTYFAPLLANAGQFDSLTAVAGDIPKIIVNGTQIVLVGDVDVDAWSAGDTAASTIGAFFYATSDDSGATWTDPQWVDPNVVPVGFTTDGINWAGWDANITSNNHIVLTGVYTNDANTERKMWGYAYDGSAWTGMNITPATGDSGYVWNGLGVRYGQQANVTVDDAGNAYSIWTDVIGITVDSGAVSGEIIGLVGAKYDGSAWHMAEVLDTLPDPINRGYYINVADKVMDNGQLAIITDVPCNDDPNDSAMFFTDPVPAGIATKVSSTIRTMNLAQNMPNPVRGNTTINYSVAKSGHVTLNVYDMSGKLVKTLVNGNVNAGTHSVVWNRTDSRNNKVAGGVYFYKIITRHLPRR